MNHTEIPVVRLYTKDDCSLCDKAKSVLEKVSLEIPFRLEEVDITKNRKIFDEFKEQIPVIFINGRKSFKYHVDERSFREKLLKCK